MSGVVASISAAPEMARRAVAKALARMQHRAPDGSRTIESIGPGREVVIGRANMWVSAEDVGSSQPFVDPSGNVTAFDGRIDNRRELLTTLELGPLTTDAAIVHAAFDRWREKSAEHLEGDFAFVLWRPSNQMLYAARDRLGVATLFYLRSGQAITIASEKEALLTSTASPRPHLESVALTLVEEYAERGPTLYEDIEALPPGTWLSWKQGRFETQTYWRLDPAARSPVKSSEDHVREYRHALEESVRVRMRTRGRVLVQLSGGLDSSTIAALAVGKARSDHLPLPLLTTARYPGFGCDETWFSERVAKHLGMDLQAVVAPSSGYEARDSLEIFHDEASLLWAMMVERGKQQNANVLLTGLGSDELFWWTGLEAEEALRDRSWLGALSYAGVFEEPLTRAPWRRLVKSVGRVASGRRPPLSTAVPAFATDQAREMIMSGRTRLRSELLDTYGEVNGRTKAAFDLTHGRAAPFSASQTTLLGHRLGVDVRHPYFDRRVVELALSMPLRERHRYDTDKLLLRRAADELLPPSIVWRSAKADFTPFFQATFASQRELVRQLFASSELERLGLVRRGGLLRALDEPRDPDDIQGFRDLFVAYHTEVWLHALRAFSQTSKDPHSPTEERATAKHSFSRE